MTRTARGTIKRVVYSEAKEFSGKTNVIPNRISARLFYDLDTRVPSQSLCRVCVSTLNSSAPE